MTCDLGRSSPAPRPDCTLGPRDQINQITSYLDASNVYGSSDQETNQLRLFATGNRQLQQLLGRAKAYCTF